MGIKNAGKAKIKKNSGKAPTKETVDTPISECKAENPLECRFHGLQALEQQLSAILPSLGYTIPFGTDKLQGGKGFEIRLNGSVGVGKNGLVDSLKKAFKKQGWNLTYNGMIDGAGHSFYLKKGNSNAELEKTNIKDNSDILNTMQSSKDDGVNETYPVDDFDDLLEEEESGAPVLNKNTQESEGDTGLTDEEIKEFLKKNDLISTTQNIADWKGLIENGETTYGGKLVDFDEATLKQFCKVAGLDNKVSKALMSKMAQHGMIEDEPTKSEDFDLKKLDTSDFDALLEENMGDFDASLKEAEGDADETPTWEEIKEFLQKAQIKDNPSQEFFEPIVLTGKLNNGKSIGAWVHILKPALADFPPDNKVVKAIKKWMDGSHNKEEPNDNAKDIPLQDFVDWAAKNFPNASPKFGQGFKDLVDTGLWFGEEFDHNLIDAAIEKYTEKDPDSPVTKVIVAKLKEIKGGVEEPKQKVSSTPYGESAPMVGLDATLMKPLEHDDSKFPPKDISIEDIEQAIKAGKKLGGYGGCDARCIEIGGKKYVCKRGKGFHAVHLKNGYYADMAYRAAGIPAPDSQLYEYEDGRTFKLSEFIEGKQLSSVWISADEQKKEAIRKELLKGYPLDALFSNHDVLGTGFDNIIIDKEGKAWRIDNDGAFAMSATGKLKTWDYGDMASTVNVEQYEYWDTREWIDDFRKMRRMKRNEGIFDHYSTAAIFTAAGNIDFDKAIEALPEIHRKALRKPVFEMKQMTWRAMNFVLGGYKDDDFVSLALDTSYEACKHDLRDLCKGKVSWNSPGFGGFSHTTSAQEFQEPKPEPPHDPRDVLQKYFKNGEYEGETIGQVIYSMSKSINYHAGVKALDPKGNVLGSGNVKSPPDYTPDSTKKANFEKIDRSKLAKLAETDMSAKTLLGLYDQIVQSQESGWKTPIKDIVGGLNITAKLPKGYQSPMEKEILDNLSDVLQKFKKEKQKYLKETLPAYEKRKAEFYAKQEAKAKQLGESPYEGFHDFANRMMELGVNTDGISGMVSNGGISFIEEAMHDQKGNSYKGKAKDWKVMMWQAMGLTLPQIEERLTDGTFINGEYAGKTVIDVINERTKGAPKTWRDNLNSMAMYMGMMTVYLENVTNPNINSESGVVMLSRNIPSSEKVSGITAEEASIYSNQEKTGWVREHPYAGADCCQFETNSWSNKNKQVYAVPFSHILCAANFSKLGGGKMENCGENEWSANLNGLPCWVYHEGMGYNWKEARELALKNEGMKDYLKRLRERLIKFKTNDMGS